MGYREKITRVISKAHENDLKTGYDDVMFISEALDAISNYHDFTIRMEKDIEVQQYRLEGSDFREWMSDYNEKRIIRHQSMINSIAQINRYCVNNGLDLFYDGPFDDERRYDDPDTRFSIAAMSDEYCSEVFMAGQNDMVNRKHIEYLKQKLAELEKKDKLPVKDETKDFSRGNEFDFGEDSKDDELSR